GGDDVLALPLAAAGRRAAAAARGKRRAGLPPRDPDREAAIHARAQRLAARVGVPAATASALMDLALVEPSPVGAAVPGISLVGAAQAATDASDPAIPRFLLRLIPPPNRLAPLLKHLPKSPQARFLEQAMARVLATSL